MCLGGHNIEFYGVGCSKNDIAMFFYRLTIHFLCLEQETPIDFDLQILTKQQSRKILELERTGLLLLSVPIKDAKHPTDLSENNIRL